MQLRGKSGIYVLLATAVGGYLFGRAHENYRQFVAKDANSWESASEPAGVVNPFDRNPTFEQLADEAIGGRFEYVDEGVKVKRWKQADFFEHQAIGKSTSALLSFFAVKALPKFSMDRSVIGSDGQDELDHVRDTYWPAFEKMEASPGPKRLGVVESQGKRTVTRTTFTFDEITGEAVCRVEVRKKGG